MTLSDSSRTAANLKKPFNKHFTVIISLLMDHVMDIDGEQLNMLTISGRSSSSGSVCGSMLGYSHSPSPTPPENGNILMDSELPAAELRDSQFDGVVVGVCAMNKKVQDLYTSCSSDMAAI